MPSWSPTCAPTPSGSTSSSWPSRATQANPTSAGRDPGSDHHHLEYHDLRFELRFADGHTASNDPRLWPRTFETEQRDPLMLYSPRQRRQ